VPTSADRDCHVVSVTDPYGRILGFQGRTLFGLLRRMIIFKEIITYFTFLQEMPKKNKTFHSHTNFPF
jgi:hypothetical protein